MGKYLRRCRRSPEAAAPPEVEFAAYLLLRSGRRVPAASSGGFRRCRRRPPPRCSSSSRGLCKAAAAARRRGGRKEEEYFNEEFSEAPVICEATSCRQSEETNPSSMAQHEHHTSTGDDDMAPTAREHQEPLPAATTAPLESELEAFFAAAELADRRRFADTYNYDIALDRPYGGRFEWVPVST